VRRRHFIRLVGGVAVAWPLAARAQQSERMRRVGVLMAIAENEEGRSRITAFREGLRVLGRVEGHDIQIEVRWAAGDVAKVQAFANELVNLKPDVILANATTALRHCKPEHATFRSSLCWCRTRLVMGWSPA
jgi:ABC-type uncharacterized transport system substrate-binding protein